jgi:hypothetical protein
MNPVKNQQLNQTVYHYNKEIGTSLLNQSPSKREIEEILQNPTGIGATTTARQSNSQVNHQLAQAKTKLR